MSQGNNILDQLDIHEIGVWPLNFRILALFLILIGSMVGSYFWLLKDNVVNLYSLQDQENKLKNNFVDAYGQAVNLDAYKKQMVDMQELLKKLLQKLPSQGEIPALLEDISQQAISSGLEFELIRPEEPVDKGFYFEQPIRMVLVGKYHGFGNFATGLSRLPRIVTLHDFVISKKGSNKESQLLEINIYAKTYWYASKEKL